MAPRLIHYHTSTRGPWRRYRTNLLIGFGAGTLLGIVGLVVFVGLLLLLVNGWLRWTYGLPWTW